MEAFRLRDLQSILFWMAFPVRFGDMIEGLPADLMTFYSRPLPSPMLSFSTSLAMNSGYYQVMFSQCPSPPALVVPQVACSSKNAFEPDLGRFKFTNTTGGNVSGPGTGPNTGSGGISGFVFNVAAFVGSVVGIAVFITILVFLYKKYGNVMRSSGGMGTNAWLHESVQKRRWFRMAEEEELRDARNSREDSISLGNVRNGANPSSRSAGGSVPSRGNSGWQQEHGMPILPPDH
ncbi:hypothetical protein BDR26DRAFT_455475 [Obelidium mucronatum]|nr:hypothetical protein BDR26DRAFT_455475 [Obelidium mucronatum]